MGIIQKHKLSAMALEMVLRWTQKVNPPTFGENNIFCVKSDLGELRGKGKGSTEGGGWERAGCRGGRWHVAEAFKY